MTIQSGAWPPGVPQDVKSFMEGFYHQSNASSTHNEHEKDEDLFASQFTSDGVYDFAGQKGQGLSGIKNLRQKLFENVPHRDHQIVKIYVHGDDYMELMALGEVEYKHHTGHVNKKEWAGRYVLLRDGSGIIKMKLAQIIIDPSGPADA